MVQIQTILKIADNSGGKFARCLKILKKGKQPRYGKVGDILIISIQNLRKRNRLLSKVRKGDVMQAVIIKTSSVTKRLSGLSFWSSQNTVILLDKQLKPVATRILGLIPLELKKHKFSKIIALSAGTF